MSTDPRARAWMEIDEGALRRNFQSLRDRAGPDAGVLPVVKSDAYGVGFERAVRAFENLGPWGYGVANVEEGAEMRRLGITRRIVVLAPLTKGGEEVAVTHRLTPGVSSIGEVERLGAEAERRGASVSIHVEIDTGMGRAGFPAARVAEWGAELRATLGRSVRLEGVFTHFHSAHVPGGPDVDRQMRRFDAAVATLRARAGGGGADAWIEHVCNSAAIVRDRTLARDLIRPGVYLYGGRPGPDLEPPEPVVSLRGRVTRVERAEPGASLGYDATYQAGRHERWATVGLGYADGLPRSLENKGFALVAGTRVPIVGRISMGLTVVDITDLTEGLVEVGATVTFLGADGGQELTLEDVAGHSGRSPYEVLTGLSPSLPRIWA